MLELEKGERTTDLFEHIEGYRQPPLIAFPNLSDPEILRRFGVRPGFMASTILRTAFGLSGLRRFARSSPEDIENALRRTESRVLAFPPVISATIVLRDDPRSPSMLQRAATLLLGARSLHRDVASGALPQDEHKGAPLEMGQYPNLFSTSLAIEGDRFRVRKARDTSTIAIALREELYTLTPWGAGETPAAPELVRSLAQIADASNPGSGHAREPAVGLLTAARDELQFRSFAELAADGRNRASLDALRDVFLTVCLEPDARPVSATEAALLAHSGHFENRWSHSSLQLIVFGNGVAAAVCSFRAWLDGNAMVRGVAEIQRRASGVGLEPPVVAPRPPASAWTKLTWRVEPQLLEAAAADVRSVLDDDPPSSFEIAGIGRRQLSTHGMAPIPVFVVALAWAVTRLTHRTPVIKQFLSLAKYRCMGIGMATVSTPAVERCVEYLEQGCPDVARFQALLSEAVKSQEQECSEVRNTLQLEELRHLFHRTQPEARRKFSNACENAALALLTRLRLYKAPARDILISHPSLHHEVVAVGRPGVRLPYVGLFAMHYGLEPERITATVARSAYSKTPNRLLADELTRALRRVAALTAALTAALAAASPPAGEPVSPGP